MPAARRAARRVAHLVGLLAVLTVVSCESGVPGIYHTLATESQRDNRNLHDGLTVSAVAEADGHYYVAAHGLWSRPIGRESWREVRRPRSGSTEMPVLAMAQSGDRLCVGTENGIFRADADPRAPAWTRSDGIDGQIVRLFAVPSAGERTTGEIAAITRSADLYVSEDGCGSFTLVNSPEDATATGRPFDVFHDGEDYWLTIGNRVYSGAELDDLTREPEAPDHSHFRGIWCLSSSRCLFGNQDGEIYENDGGNWEKLGRIENPDDDARSVPLTWFIQIGDRILIGTRGFGFYQFDAGDDDLVNIRRGPRSTSQLYRAHITMFVRHGDLVFAGTAGGGLSSIEVATAATDTGTWDWE